MDENKYLKVIRKAYERNEMTELLGCKESYSLDENGKYYLNQDIRLTGAKPNEDDPIDLEALISATELFYCSLDRKSGERKQFLAAFINALLELVESHDIDNLYFATEIYFILGNREKKDGFFYPLKGIAMQIKNPIEKKLIEKKSELKTEKKYAGSNQTEGLWSVLMMKNATSYNDIQLNFSKY